MNAPEVIEGDYTETTAIAIRPDQTPAPSSLFAAMRPAERVHLATEVANALNDVIVKRKLFTDIQGKRHVRVEGWQTCGMLCGVTAKVTTVDRISDPDGFRAHAVVVRVESGIEVGAGEGVCTRKESRWKSADDYAVASMAQTRAVSRALRGVLGWIVALAGYEATPAEEVPSGGFDHAPLASPAPTPQPPKVPTAELVALAQRKGVELGPWLEKHIAPDLARRPKKTLSTEESDRAKHALEALPDPTPRDPSEPQRALLFALHSQLRHNDGDRHLIYKRIAGKTSSKDLSAGDISRVIDYLNTLTEGS